ncbi:hypothetical protein JOC86_003741 [Bacillus pakistanensis]|uniref:Uncharacterized protein n=1 Tax=Rossellomorea pakistanensis TaxID=992288 RepID=A0ABS2NH70_9BACI|nr:hypothetical protein [Bacillus pakistanensis]MBM7587168.1 hypothetical protein [Bacillus pakistanensis]
MKSSNEKMNDEFSQILQEPDIEHFLLEFQNYLTNRNNDNERPKNKKYSLPFYRDLRYLDVEIGKLYSEEKRLLKVKVDSIITYHEEIIRNHFPSPLTISVFTAVISFILGVMIKDFTSYPDWAIIPVVICLVLIIPAISWFNIDQSGKDAELKEILSNIKGVLEIQE